MYSFISSTNIEETIFQMNHVSKEILDAQFDFECKDEVFFRFKEKLLSIKEKRILIVGDYDCDGIASVTIMKRLLNHLNIDSNYYIPSRIKEGYGLNEAIVQKAIDHHFDAMLMLDNGITALKEIEVAQKAGIEVFIIDHHEYDALPKNCTILHPRLINEIYSKLSAAGLCFILSKMFYDDDLSLVLGGLSQLSDMTSVLGLNRCLIKEMMHLLQTKNIYSFYLLNDLKPICYEDLSFTIIPKINAVSRMEPLGNPNYVVKFFLSDESYQNQYIETINYINEQRKISSKELLNYAMSLCKGHEIEVLVSEKFKEGLCGLLANRLSKSLNKSIICLAKSDGLLKGSARALDGINLHEYLKDYPCYETFGGHEGALGFTLKQENEEDFRHFISNIQYDSQYEKEAILIDENSDLKSVLDTMEALKPYGEGFKEPLLALQNNHFKKIIVAKKYPKYLIHDDFSAISFDENKKEIDPIYLIGHLKEDGYRKKAFSFLIEDMLP